MGKIISPTLWRFTHRDKNGLILWRDDWAPNLLTDEGEQNMLETYFRAENTPANFYLGLVNDTPVEADGLSDLTGEPSTNGYARELVARGTSDWTVAQDSGDYQATSATVQFAASGGSIGPVTYGILATTTDNSGLLIAARALSGSRTLADGETLDVDITLKLS